MRQGGGVEANKVKIQVVNQLSYEDSQLNFLLSHNTTTVNTRWGLGRIECRQTLP